MISPYVNESATYDSNIEQASQDAESGWFMNSEAGLRAGYSAYMIDATALGYGGYRNYADETRDNFGFYGESASLKYGLRERLQVQADEYYHHVSDIDTHGSEMSIGGISPDSVMDVAARAKRNLCHVGLSAGRDMSDKVQLDAGYRYDSARYDEADLADLNGHVGQLEGAYKITEKSAAFATLFGGAQKNSVVAGAADYYGTRLGGETRGTDKISLKAGAGVEQYNRPSGSAGDNKTAFNFDVTANWVVTDKIRLHAGGLNGTSMSSVLPNNASDYTAVWAGAVYRVIPTVGLSLDGIYRIDDYLDPVTVAGGGSVDRKDKGTALSARADYQTPAAFLDLYAQASYESTDSNISDYNETRVTVGVDVKY